MMKCCKRCDQTKSLEEFNKRKTRKGEISYQSYCRPCANTNQRAWYDRNRDHALSDIRARKNGRKKWFADFKAGLKCERCPETHPACLDFHHTDPAEKSVNLGQKARDMSKDNILAEIAKCIVLCSNCHRKEHYGERDNLPPIIESLTGA